MKELGQIGLVRVTIAIVILLSSHHPSTTCTTAITAITIITAATTAVTTVIRQHTQLETPETAPNDFYPNCKSEKLQPLEERSKNMVSRTK